MAFKILDSEELSLLSDNQRIQYEKELDIYQQRVAFVERLEMFENAHIEPYEPKLEPISMINEIEVKPFEKTEYVMSLCEPVEKPDLQIKSFKKTEQTAPVLPQIQKQVKVCDKRIQKIERSQPDLPSVVKPEVMVVSFKQSEKKQAKLPTVASPSIKMTIPYETLKNNLHNTPSNIPDVVMPGIDINHIAVPEKTQPSLPDVSVCAAKTITFIKPEKHDTKLPTVAKPDISVNSYKGIEPVQPDLPEVSAVLHMAKEFHMPEQRKTELPVVGKPDISVRSFEKIECDITDLPELTDIGFKSEDFTSRLSRVSNLKVEVMAFDKPESVKYDVPAVKTSVEVRKLEKLQPDIAAPSIPGITVKEFKIQQKEVSNLPVINITEAPDAYSKIKELLLKSGEN